MGERARLRLETGDDVVHDEIGLDWSTSHAHAGRGCEGGDGRRWGRRPSAALHPYLEGFGAFPENAKNVGVHVVLGRHKDTPEELLDGQDVFLMGDCTKTPKNCLDEVGAISYHVIGCPSPEPTLGWAIVDHVDMGEIAPDEHEKLRVQIRKRLEYEEILFEEWMAKQGRS